MAVPPTADAEAENCKPLLSRYVSARTTFQIFTSQKVLHSRPVTNKSCPIASLDRQKRYPAMLVWNKHPHLKPSWVNLILHFNELEMCCFFGQGKEKWLAAECYPPFPGVFNKVFHKRRGRS